LPQHGPCLSRLQCSPKCAANAAAQTWKYRWPTKRWHRMIWEWLQRNAVQESASPLFSFDHPNSGFILTICKLKENVYTTS
jgi:hypothetical protein